MRESSSETVTLEEIFFRYSEGTVGVDYQNADSTQLLMAWAGGDRAALDVLAPRVYRELRRLAMDFMKRERQEPVLQPTALVHEVYLKLIEVQNVAVEGKAHFYAICAQMMRRILVDAARHRAASKRGGGAGTICLEDAALLPIKWKSDKQLIALNDALDELARGEPRRARVVELRYFGGLSVPDTAVVLKVSEETVTRDWRLARGWLRLQFRDGDAAAQPAWRETPGRKGQCGVVGRSVLFTIHWSVSITEQAMRSALFAIVGAALLCAQTQPPAQIVIAGDLPARLVLTAEDLAKMPREKATVPDQDGTKVEYEGVLLREILKRAGAPVEKELRGKALASYIVAKARDGYQVVFTLAEVAAEFANEAILVADKRDGKALFGYQGPYRLVCPSDKAGARSVRMLESLEFVRLQK